MAAIIPIAILFTSFDTDVENPESFEQHPPLPEKFWVQKVLNAEDQPGNIILKVKFVNDEPLPIKINLFGGGAVSNMLVDNGTSPDDIAGDGIYACYILDNMDLFLSQIQTAYDNVQTRGFAPAYRGNTNFILPASEIGTFNLADFNNGIAVEVPLAVISPQDCETLLKKENSLLITDLSVVEDPTRTYNFITHNGAIDGEWTFGHLMRNIINPTGNASQKNQQIKDFLKHWVSNWMQTNNNGYSTDLRLDAVFHLIKPWIENAKSVPIGSLVIDEYNWENFWDDPSVSGESLLRNAPFNTYCYS